MRHLVVLVALLAASAPAYAENVLSDTLNVKGRGSAPSSPASGRYRLYFDTATHALKWKNSAGTVFTASTGGGGGSVDGLKAAYEAASTTSQNILAMSTTLGSFRLRDNATPITGEEIFAVENSTGSSIYFSAYVNGVYIGKPLLIDTTTDFGGNVTASAGNFDLSGSSGTWKPPTGGFNAHIRPNAANTWGLGGFLVELAFVNSYQFHTRQATFSGGGAITIDPSSGGESAVIQLGAVAVSSITVAASSSFGQRLYVIVSQDGTGGRSCPTTWTNVTFPGGTYTVTSTLNKSDLITLQWDNTASKWRASLAQNQ